MKNILLAIFVVMPLMANAESQSQALRTVKSLGLHEFYCSIEGRTQGKDSFHFNSTKDVFAANEDEAIKLCLLKVNANTFMDDGELIVMARDFGLSKDPVTVDKISVRPGQM